MATGRKCIECGGINELYAVACTGCGADLRYAPELVDEPVPADQPPTPAAESEITAALGHICTCPRPDAAPGEVHFACGGIVPLAEGRPVEPQTPPRSVTPATAATPRMTPPSARDMPIVVTLPGGRQIEVGRGCFIGRDQKRADILVHAALASLKGVSLAHAWICCAGNDVVVLDLGSRNGTWIDDRCLTPWQAHVVALDDLPIDVRLGLHGVLKIEVDAAS